VKKHDPDHLIPTHINLYKTITSIISNRLDSFNISTETYLLNKHSRVSVLSSVEHGPRFSMSTPEAPIFRHAKRTANKRQIECPFEQVASYSRLVRCCDDIIADVDKILMKRGPIRRNQFRRTYVPRFCSIVLV
jgi:hypothetical protein